MKHSNRQQKSNKQSVIDLNTVMFGKIPPQAIELEDAIIGAIMLEKRAFEIVSEILNESCFYTETNKMLFKTFKNLSNKNIPIDLLTVVQELS